MTSILKPQKMIEGARIQLLAQDPVQAFEMWSLIEKNREHLRPWMPWETQTKTVEDSLAYLISAQAWWDEGSTFDFSIVEKGSQKLLGCFGIHSIQWDKKSAHFGYWIDKAHEGQGLITEAIQMGEKVASELGLHRVLISCDRKNERSKKTALNLGYFKESLQVDECLDDHGNFRDTVQFVKLLNPKIEGRITENLPHGYSIEEVGPDYFWEAVDKKRDFVFSEDLIFRARSIYSEFENQKLATLDEGFVTPYRYFAVVRFENEVVGWTWGYQDSKDSFYMVNSGLLAEHRGKGLYSRLLKNVMKVLVEKGFQRVWSRHNMTNNEILIPKLKFGFHITGTELSDSFGVLVHLTYFSNSFRRRVLNFRSGHERPNSEMRKVLGLEP